MKTFYLHQFTQHMDNGAVVLAADASELRLAPGEWPDKIEIVGGPETIRMHRTSLGDGGARYEQALTKVAALIFND